MKSKIIYMITAVAILGLSIGMHKLDIEGDRNRVHQHLESGWQESSVQNNNKFQSHLPIIKIDTLGQKVPGTPVSGTEGTWDYETTESGDTNITASLSVVDLQKGSNSPEDKPTIKSLAQIRYRGNSSRFFDKKGYAINLVRKDGTENKKEIAGMEIHDEWILNAPFLDRSLLRNYVALNISGEIMEYAPNIRYCELFVDEEYQGVYTLMESVSKGEGRINIKKPDKKSNITDYIIRLDREGKGDQEINDYSNYTNKNGVSAIDVRYPGSNQITEARKRYIEKDISKLEKGLYSYDLKDKNKGYTKYIDVNAFAEYFIINEFFRNMDAGRFSTFYYKPARGKLKPCPWDFNNACDNYIDYQWDEIGFNMIYQPIFDQLIKDKKFIDVVVYKYKKLRNDKLSEKYLTNYIDETSLWLGESVDRNYEKWGYVFDLSNYNGMNYLTPVDRNYTSYNQSVNQLKEYLVKRGNWLDKNIEVLYQYSHDSKNTNDLIK